MFLIAKVRSEISTKKTSVYQEYLKKIFEAIKLKSCRSEQLGLLTDFLVVYLEGIFGGVLFVYLGFRLVKLGYGYLALFYTICIVLV